MGAILSEDRYSISRVRTLADSSMLFEPLRMHLARLSRCGFPAPDSLQRCLDDCRPAVLTASGLPLRVTWPGAARAQHVEDSYEAGIYLRGEMPVRPGNWHDVFNVLVWMVFPRTKAVLNRLHYRDIAGATGARTAHRSRRRDALTLFDESGIVLVSSDASLLDCVRRFAWKELFWERRGQAAGALNCLVFGHALYEKSLAPYVGMSAHALLLEVDGDLLRAPLAARVHHLDGRLATLLADPEAAADPRSFSPLPLLGIPGWWPENESAAFYDNVRYFRPGRKIAAKA